jgi:uncharacterized membrane protein YfbV (UPF0208 family)
MSVIDKLIVIGVGICMLCAIAMLLNIIWTSSTMSLFTATISTILAIVMPITGLLLLGRPTDSKKD